MVIQISAVEVATFPCWVGEFQADDITGEHRIGRGGHDASPVIARVERMIESGTTCPDVCASRSDGTEGRGRSFPLKMLAGVLVLTGASSVRGYFEAGPDNRSKIGVHIHILPSVALVERAL